MTVINFSVDFVRIFIFLDVFLMFDSSFCMFTVEFRARGGVFGDFRFVASGPARQADGR